MVSVRLGPEPTTNSKPIAPGTVVMKEIVPSGFLRELTSLFHSPKSKIVEAPDVLTLISPSKAGEKVFGIGFQLGIRLRAPVEENLKQLAAEAVANHPSGVAVR